jgi:hypothetical protein
MKKKKSTKSIGNKDKKQKKEPKKKSKVKKNKLLSVSDIKLPSSQQILETDDINKVFENKIGGSSKKKGGTRIYTRDYDYTRNKNSNMTYNILFCEPTTQFSKEDLYYSYEFRIHSDFYVHLLHFPIKKYNVYNKINYNVYIFGKFFNDELSKYKYMGFHKTIHGQTGFVDITGISKMEKEKLADNKLWNQIIGEQLNWGTVIMNERVKKNMSNRVLFIGDTVSGNKMDVGCDLFAHFDSNNNIDSLIIGNFPNKTLSMILDNI